MSREYRRKRTKKRAKCKNAAHQQREVDIEVRRISRKKGGKVEILKKNLNPDVETTTTIVTTRTSSLGCFRYCWRF